MSSRLIDLARRRELAGDPVVRQELAKLYTAERVLAFVGQKLRDEIAAGVEVGARGSVAKLATALLARQSSSLGMVVAGAGSLAWDRDDPDGELLARECCFSPMTAIAGGTSEIQRNTIGERVLGLPKEPQVDRELPFNQILQNPAGARSDSANRS
jgi:alkylation response protein AidB-like acyl-CoA dehydrogenase